MEPPKKKPQWGLYDTTDKLWLGDEDGPAIYTDEVLAKLSAMIIDERMGWCDRTKAVPFNCPHANLVDTVDFKRTGEEVLQELEGDDGTD